MKLLVLFLLFCVAVAHELSDCAPGPGPGPDRPKNPKDKDGGVPDKVDKGHLREALKIKWKTKKGRSFLFVPFPYPWAVAQLFCQKLGGILATVHHQKVDTFLVNLSGGKPAWIGFSDAQQNGVWLWIGGEPDQHANWCRGQPDNLQGEQNCALISWGPKTCWDDQSCLTLLPFICEKRR